MFEYIKLMIVLITQIETLCEAYKTNFIGPMAFTVDIKGIMQAQQDAWMGMVHNTRTPKQWSLFCYWNYRFEQAMCQANKALSVSCFFSPELIESSLKHWEKKLSYC